MVYKEIFKIQICEYLNYKHLYLKIRENSKFLEKRRNFEHLKASYSLNHHAILLYTDSGNHLSSSLEGIQGSEKTQVHESILWQNLPHYPLLFEGFQFRWLNIKEIDAVFLSRWRLFLTI